MKCTSLALLILFIIIGISSCKKDSFITNKDAFVSFSDDTLHFDTVFTSTGSTTQFFKVFNNNDQKLLINNIQLMGGSNSYFKLNVDGSAGTNFNRLELAANDSIYSFVTVSINPTDVNTPFVIRDSIKIEYNGNVHYLQLEAYGQNAYFLNNRTITEDTIWTNTKPIVILGGLTISSTATLTLEKGTRVYVNAKAPILVNGSLQAYGQANARVSFQSDRIDVPYRDYPGSWPGIYFNDSSTNSVLQYCLIKNAYQGVIVKSPTSDNSTKLTLNECILDNIYDVAIGGSNTSINARNCLVSNCGYNVSLISGGTYTFNHCTLASYANTYLDHKNSVLTLSNTNSDNTLVTPLSCTINNSILYGGGGSVDDEIALVKNTSTPFSVTFNSVLYKTKKAIDLTKATLNNCIANQSPLFDSVNTGNRVFDFHLVSISPCIRAGDNTNILFDLDGNKRPASKPDLGCYQRP